MSIYVDCTAQGQNDDLKKRFAIRGFPTVMFLDSSGAKVEDLQSRDAAGMRAQIERVVQQHSRPVVSDSTIEAGLALAREQGKLLAVAFMDPQEAGTAALLDLVLSEPMAEMRGRFHWIRRPLSGERGRPTDEAKENGAKKSPTLLLLDPWAEGEDRELKKVTSFRSLPRDLGKVLEAAEKRGHPPAAGAGGDAPATPPAEDDGDGE